MLTSRFTAVLTQSAPSVVGGGEREPGCGGIPGRRVPRSLLETSETK